MISLEHRLMTNPKTIQAPPFRLMSRPETSQSSESSVRHWCNLGDKAHELNTCETFLDAKEHAKGEKNMPIVATIETEEISDEVYAAISRSQAPFRPTLFNGTTSGPNKANFNDKFPPRPTQSNTRLSPISQSSNGIATQSIRLSGYTPYNLATDLANLKANISFLDVLRAP